jgi:hypothetical protein
MIDLKGLITVLNYLVDTREKDGSTHAEIRISGLIDQDRDIFFTVFYELDDKKIPEEDLNTYMNGIFTGIAFAYASDKDYFKDLVKDILK